jgi:hypothetical protein
VPRRSDQSYVEPENERVPRLIGEASWDWARTTPSAVLHRGARSFEA